MRRRLHSGLHRLVGVLAPAALLLALAAAPAQAAMPIDYVALGDSYSAGTGAPPYELGLCFRSRRGYPALWATSHPVSSFRYVACGGATTASMTDQFAALTPNTDLVTITIGGNDVGFFTIVLDCVLGTDRSCGRAVDDAITDANATLPVLLDTTYARIRSGAPNATVVVFGYPRLVEPNGRCLTPAKRAALNRGADALAAVIAARAGAAGFRFVDPRGAFAGHGACGAAPWIHPFSLLQLVESFHPNATGYAQGYRTLLNAVTG